jgi:hypothetical protein
MHGTQNIKIMLMMLIHILGEKIKYMVMSRDQSAEQNSNIKICNKSFETVEQFKYLGTTLTN